MRWLAFDVGSLTIPLPWVELSSDRGTLGRLVDLLHTSSYWASSRQSIPADVTIQQRFQHSRQSTLLIISVVPCPGCPKHVPLSPMNYDQTTIDQS